MNNPNNCAACLHKQNPDGGWCYMFSTAPTTICAQHSARNWQPWKPATAANRYCRAGMCVSTDTQHEAWCTAHGKTPNYQAKRALPEGE